MDRNISLLREKDALTGLLSRTETQKQIEAALSENTASALIVMDLNHFSLINDRYGHLLGDRVLKGAATVFRYMFWPKDIIGRIGGDEFAALIRGDCSPQMIADKTKQLKGRLRDISSEEKIRGGLTAAVGYAFARPGVSYAELLTEARAQIAASKPGLKPDPAQKADFAETGVSHKTVCKDIALIRKELKESGKIEGAYCPDYESFKRIYRFVERGLRRSGNGAYVILITLGDEEGNFPPLAQRAEQMEILRETIQYSLRTGDAFCQYSSGQYILMVLGASDENALMIAKRVYGSFEDAMGKKMEDVCLFYDVYPMDPV